MNALLRRALVLLHALALVTAGLTAAAGEAPVASGKDQAESTDSRIEPGTTVPDAGGAAAQIGDDRLKAVQIHELIVGTLSTETDAQSLFDVSLDDAGAVALEASRLAVLLQNAAGEPAATAPGSAATVTVDAGIWNDRQELDRARLQFYGLPPDQRSVLLTAHRERQAEGSQSRANTASADADARARAADLARDNALASARSARSEAERLVAEERARLLSIASQLAERQAELARIDTTLTERAERTLAYRRRVRQALESGSSAPVGADTLYNELRAWLRASRTELAKVLATRPPPIPQVRAEADPLANLPVQLDRQAIDQLYQETLATAALLERQAAESHRKQASQLYDEVLRLNDDRLALLPYLSPQRRSAITGFGTAGIDQAIAELRQVSLVLEYHANRVSQWLGSAGRFSWPAAVAGSITGALLRILVVIAVFYWGRRIAATMLGDWRDRLRETARRKRTLESSRVDRFISLLLHVLNPVSWVLLVLATFWVLPQQVSSLMEMELLLVVLLWCLGGWLAVITLNALAMRRASRFHWRQTINTDVVRIKSLRLVGIAVVVTGLILSTSSRIVGPGTVYSWVLSSCWWAALPIGLVIVRWWREVIFDRVNLRRRKNALLTWVTANRTGWRSLLAAIAGGAYLFFKGALDLLKSWLGDFELTRRLLAYLFRQQLDRIAERQPATALSPLPAATLAMLSPATSSTEILEGDDGASVKAIIQHIERTRGGVYAVTGERGSGRSSVLQRVSATRDKVTIVNCPFDGIESLTKSMARAAGMPDDSTLESVAEELNSRSEDAAVIIDNAHRLIHPVMGGSDQFDRLLERARQHSTQCSWIFSMDRVVWRFYARAHSVNMLFDSVLALEGWSEEGIAALLQSRCRQAGIEPAFDQLIPAVLDDEYERREILANAAENYYRLIWDYAAGNPGVALHSWRTSLGVAADGRIFVTPFRVPDGAILEELPNAAVFVLRAILQLERARAEDIAKATMVPMANVESTLYFGMQSGFLHQVDGRYAITWNWYRPITRFLQRRHLLASD